MTPHANGRRLSVLVVDDNRDTADTLAVFLSLKGHDTRIAYNGEQALAAVRDWQPDAAVLDVLMDGVSGVELARQLRHEVARPVLLVALTGANDEVARVQAGAFDHVFLKPVDPDELLGLLGARARGRPPGHSEPQVDTGR